MIMSPFNPCLPPWQRGAQIPQSQCWERWKSIYVFVFLDINSIRHGLMKPSPRSSDDSHVLWMFVSDTVVVIGGSDDRYRIGDTPWHLRVQQASTDGAVDQSTTREISCALSYPFCNGRVLCSLRVLYEYVLISSLYYSRPYHISEFFVIH